MKTLHGGGELEFYNLALGATSCIQNLYEITRHKSLLKNAELIIAESNINDMQELASINSQIVLKNIALYYQLLHNLNKKILVFILPYKINYIQKINDLHKFYCKKYHFNIIEMEKFYQQHNLFDLLRPDPYHLPNHLMRMLGRKIIENINSFHFNATILHHQKIQISICTPETMLKNKIIEKIERKNSAYNETIYRLKSGDLLTFSKKLSNWNLIAIHAWNSCNKPWQWPKSCGISSDIVIKNANSILVKAFSYNNQVSSIYADFKIDNNTQVSFNSDKLKNTEKNPSAAHIEEDLEYIDIIGFLLVNNFHANLTEFENSNQYNELEFGKYDFTFLINETPIIKDLLDEWENKTSQTTINKLNHTVNLLNQQIQTLTNEKNILQNEKTSLQNSLNSLPIKKQKLEVLNLEQDLINKKLQSKKLAKDIGVKLDVLMPKITFINPNSAKARIHNHLAYKLGNALIRNSKSFLGYIKMPYVLFAITLVHKEQNANSKLIKLPSLESYADYKEALKEKECFTYKLGEALMKAHKNWYGGGYIKFILKDVPRLKRKFKK